MFQLKYQCFTEKQVAEEQIVKSKFPCMQGIHWSRTAELNLNSPAQGAQVSPHCVHRLHSKEPECSRLIVLMKFIMQCNSRCIRLIFCAVQENLPTWNESKVFEMIQFYIFFLNIQSRPSLTCVVVISLDVSAIKKLLQTATASD